MTAWRSIADKALVFLLLYALSGLPMWSGLLAGARRWEAPLGTALWVISIPVFLLWVWFLTPRVGIDGFRGLGLLRHRGWGRNLAVGFAVGLVQVLAILGLGWWSGAFEITAIRAFSPLLLLFPVLEFGYVALSEELIHRGLLPKLLPRSLSPVWISLISATIFAAVHLRRRGFVPDYMLQLFLSGLFLVIITLVTGSLWFAIGSHWAFNIFNPLLIEHDLVIAKAWLPGSPWATWDRVLVQLVLLLVLPLLLRLLARQEKPAEQPAAA